MNESQRNSIEIRVWMMREGIKRRDIETGTGLSGTAVTLTIDGIKNCRGVLRYLKDNGCPAEFLALPGDMREAA